MARNVHGNADFDALAQQSAGYDETELSYYEQQVLQKLSDEGAEGSMTDEQIRRAAMNMMDEVVVERDFDYGNPWYSETTEEDVDDMYRQSQEDVVCVMHDMGHFDNYEGRFSGPDTAVMADARNQLFRNHYYDALHATDNREDDYDVYQSRYVLAEDRLMDEGFSMDDELPAYMAKELGVLRCGNELKEKADKAFDSLYDDMNDAYDRLYEAQTKHGFVLSDENRKTLQEEYHHESYEQYCQRVYGVVPTAGKDLSDIETAFGGIDVTRKVVSQPEEPVRQAEAQKSAQDQNTYVREESAERRGRTVPNAPSEEQKGDTSESYE